jgi:hypothetical protein
VYTLFNVKKKLICLSWRKLLISLHFTPLALDKPLISLTKTKVYTFCAARRILTIGCDAASRSKEKLDMAIARNDIRVDTHGYMMSHGRAPRGYGNWLMIVDYHGEAFDCDRDLIHAMSKVIDEKNIRQTRVENWADDNDTIGIWVNGTYSEARRIARQICASIANKSWEFDVTVGS